MSSHRRWVARIRAQRGVTLIEATIVLAVATILISAMAPVASRTLGTARQSRAVQDTDAIATAIGNFLTDFTTFTPFTTTALTGGTTVQMLVGDGDIPRAVSLTGSADWDDPVAAGPPAIDFLERHLVTNNPITSGSYNTASCAPVSAPTNCWRGAYLNAPLDPDPWGNRYAVNTLYLRSSTANDVFVLSTGQDEEIDTAFTVNGATPGDDDIISVIRRDVGGTVP